MSEAKHTPGPWTVGEQCAQRIAIWHRRTNITGAISATLAEVTARPTWQREAEANARLIAAAPTMLEAILDAIAVLDSPASNDHDFDRCADILRAVAAKATGEQP